MLQLPPLSLYIHIPWCVRKCPYCDFNSHEFSQDIPEQDYLEALLKDLVLDLSFVQGRALQSIFIGGGTPSLMSPKFYRALFERLQAHLDFAEEIEITLEANPGTTEAERFLGYYEAGINRLSLGVQSFQDAQLKALGRIHSGEQAYRAIEQAKAAGYRNFNIDLMHGLPEQSPEQAMIDIERALSLGPTHLSWYQLTVEPNTAFYSDPPVLPVEEDLWRIQQEGSRLLQAHGYDQYEVSAFAKKGYRARHNVNYWQFGDYLGIGAGAHAKVTILDQNENSKRLLRYRKSRLPKDYLLARPSYRVGEQWIAKDELPFEFMMNALRLVDGVPEELFERRTGLPLAAVEPVLSSLRKQSLMQANRLQLTEQGYGFLNSILEQFL